MMKNNPQYIDIEIDKLTNSVTNVITGDNFQTVVSLINVHDLKSVSKRNGWLFNWKSEFKLPDRDVYKLTIEGNPEVIQGLISITEREDHIYMHLIESAPFNLGHNKVYIGVPGNLVGFYVPVGISPGIRRLCFIYFKITTYRTLPKNFGSN